MKLGHADHDPITQRAVYSFLVPGVIGMATHFHFTGKEGKLCCYRCLSNNLIPTALIEL